MPQRYIFFRYVKSFYTNFFSKNLILTIINYSFFIIGIFIRNGGRLLTEVSTIMAVKAKKLD